MVIDRCVCCGNRNVTKIKLVYSGDSGSHITNRYRCECCGAEIEEHMARLWVKHWTSGGTLIYNQKDFSKNY